MLRLKIFKPQDAVYKTLLGTLVLSVLYISSAAQAKLQTDAQAIKRATQKKYLLAQNSSMSIGQPATSVVMQVPAPEKKAEKPWAIEMNLEQASNLVDESDPNHDASATFTFIPSYKITDKLTGAFRTDVTKEQVGAENTKLADSSVSLTLKGFKFNETFSTLHILTGFIPTSEKSRDDDKLKGAGSIGNRIVAETSFGKYSYTLGYRQNVHEYNVNRSSEPNIKYTVSHRVITATPLFGSKFSFNSDLIYRNSWTYRDFQRANFSFSLDLGYEATDAFSVYVGTTNEGSALKANGRDSNIEFYNDRTSVLRAGLTYVL